MAETSPKDIAAGLSRLLADTYAVYLKTHGYHWNVRGPNFGSLHALFMTHYTEMWAAIDLIAERIRALGELAPQGYGAFAQLSSIKDGDPAKSANDMLKELVADHAALVATAKAAREGADDVTASLIDARVEAHEKHAWMLNVSIG
jgi:starvation-inducible DNA-binding protein